MKVELTWLVFTSIWHFQEIFVQGLKLKFVLMFGGKKHNKVGQDYHNGKSVRQPVVKDHMLWNILDLKLEERFYGDTLYYLIP